MVGDTSRSNPWAKSRYPCAMRRSAALAPFKCLWLDSLNMSTMICWPCCFMPASSLSRATGSCDSNVGGFGCSSLKSILSMAWRDEPVVTWVTVASACLVNIEFTSSVLAITSGPLASHITASASQPSAIRRICPGVSASKNGGNGVPSARLVTLCATLSTFSFTSRALIATLGAIAPMAIKSFKSITVAG